MQVSWSFNTFCNLKPINKTKRQVPVPHSQNVDRLSGRWFAPVQKHSAIGIHRINSPTIMWVCPKIRYLQYPQTLMICRKIRSLQLSIPKFSWFYDDFCWFMTVSPSKWLRLSPIFRPQPGPPGPVPPVPEVPAHLRVSDRCARPQNSGDFIAQRSAVFWPGQICVYIILYIYIYMYITSSRNLS